MNGLVDWTTTLVWMFRWERKKWLLWCLIIICLLDVLVLWCYDVLAMVENVCVICFSGVLAMVGWCVGDICLLGVLIIIMLVVVVWGMFLVWWFGVWHVLVVSLGVCGLIILLARVLCVCYLVILLGFRCWSLLCVSGLTRVVYVRR